MDPAQIDIARLSPHSRLFEKRIVFLRGALEEGAADDIIAQLLALDALSAEDVTLLIDSPGGDVGGLFAIYDAIQTMRSTVHTRCVGLAASAAAVILAGGTGTRSATPNSRVLIHQPHGRIPAVSETDIQIHVKEFVYLRGRMEEILAETTGQTVEKLHADMDRDLWMSAADAKDYGIIDEIVAGPGPRLRSVD